MACVCNFQLSCNEIKRGNFRLYWKARLLEDISVLAPIDIQSFTLTLKSLGKRKVDPMFHKISLQQILVPVNGKTFLHVRSPQNFYFQKLNIAMHWLSEEF